MGQVCQYHVTEVSLQEQDLLRTKESQKDRKNNTSKEEDKEKVGQWRSQYSLVVVKLYR